MSRSPASREGTPTEVMTASIPEEEPAPQSTEVFVLNHHRDEMATTLDALRRRGFSITETQSIIETHRVLANSRPCVIVLNPLVLQAGSVELEVLEELQRDDDPIPVVMLLENLDAVYTAARSKLPIRDFITKPYSTEELLHRTDLILEARERYMTWRRRIQELESLALKDFKTGLTNDRHFTSIESVEFKRAQRHNTPLALLLIDVDDFKTVNDSASYHFGNEALVHVANSIQKTVRATDFPARIGGDEFAVLLPHTTPKEAVRTAERVREAICDTEVTKGEHVQTVTVSIGIGAFDGRSRFSAEELHEHANKALHEAKLEGKNRVALYSE